MAKCKKCGKVTFFIFLRKGLCKDCRHTLLLPKNKNDPTLNENRNQFSNMPSMTVKSSNILVKRESNNNIDNFSIPDKVLKLLWFKDGKYKNYNSLKLINSTISSNFEIKVTFVNEEPSLISVNYPIAADITYPDRVAPPNYFPTYEGLTPEQRYIYLKFLEQPYNDKVDIGYVFIFYYGLERHLYCGDFENAYNMILELRKVHKNNSFQNYSFMALATMSIVKDRIDLFDKLVAETTERRETLYINFFLLSKVFTKQHITAEELMSYSRDFGFTNIHYIKEYPELFKNYLTSELAEKGYIYPYKILNIREASKYEAHVFANFSISATILFPNLSENFKLKAETYRILMNVHEKVKAELRVNRANHTKTEAKKKQIVYPEDSDYPNIDLYLDCNKPINPNELALTESPAHYEHIRYMIAIREIYKNRQYPKALKHCIELCEKDINLVLTHNQNSSIQPYDYSSFKRLIIIYEKQHDYNKCIELCHLALNAMNKAPNNPFNISYESYFKDKLEKLLHKN